MSTIRQRSHDPAPRRKDPYFYGFRYLTLPGMDGQTHVVLQPLTREDVLHPQEGDHITQNDYHTLDFIYLREVFDARVPRLRHLRRPIVLGDCLIDLGVEGIKPVGPDVAVFTNVPRRKGWGTFTVHKEKARWVLVGEVTSPSTRENDLDVKPDHYWRAGVPLMFIVDQISMRGGVRQLRLMGYERGRRDWRELPLSTEGRLWLEPLQLWLGVDTGRVVCYDAEGREIENYAGVEEARQQAETARTEAEAARTEAETARFQAEAARAEAEARVRQLEEELRRLREGG